MAEQTKSLSTSFNVDAVIANHRSGRCMCGSQRGKIIYGPSPFGYGNTCGRCRRIWSRREHKPWRSNQQIMDDDRAERHRVRLEVEEMPPAEFYAAWAEMLNARLEQQGPRWRWYDMKQDEFGVTGFGSATGLGWRYHCMRERVRRDLRIFEEARCVA